MNCNEFQSSIEQAVETRRPVPEAVQAHAEQCAHQECQAIWDEFLVLNRALAEWNRVEPTDLADRVMASLSAFPVTSKSSSSASAGGNEQTPTPRRKPVAWASVVSLAAVGCLVVAISARSPNRPEGSIPLAAAQPDDEVTDQAALVASQDKSDEAALDQTDQSEGVVYAQWVVRASSRVTDTVALVLRQRDPSQTAASPSPTEQGPGWLRTWTPELVPLEQTLQETWEFLTDPGDKNQTNLLPLPADLG